MAGGYGKRLLPFTENCPKPMLDLNGRPILEHIINNLSNQGFNRIHIALREQAIILKHILNQVKNLELI